MSLYTDSVRLVLVRSRFGVDVMEEERRTFTWHLWAPAAIFLFSTLHLTACLILGAIFLGNERKCRNVYEYYSPWGWGKRKGRQYILGIDHLECSFDS